MKVLPFTIPVSINQTIVVQPESLPFFYPHLHRHNEIQLTWIQKGEGTLVAENNMHSFTGNEIYWLGANLPHVFKSEPGYFLPKSKKRCTALTIFFNPAGKLASVFELPELKSIRKFMEEQQGGFKVPTNLVGDISSQLLKLKAASGVDQLTDFLLILKKLAGSRSLVPLSSGNQRGKYSEHEGLKIGGIYNYIIQHYDKSITLEDVAGQAHMTPQAFCRYFKKHTRHTFISFLNEVRINKACKQLTDGDYESISAVAYHCGFNSVTSFNRVFKSVKALSPSEYLDSFHKNVDN